MRVLITGGAGMIGSHLAEALVERGDKVVVIDNLATGRMNNIPKDVEGYHINHISSKECEGFLDLFPLNVVVHCAASYKNPNDWREDLYTNALGTVNVVNIALKHEVKRFVYLQTSLCYGPPQHQPITLDHPINPQTSYAISKTAGEQYIMMSGLDWVSFRLANFYGPRGVAGPIPVFYKKLMNGEQCTIAETRRDYVYVTDLVDILVKAVDGGPGGLYQVSSGSDVSILEIYEAIRNAMCYSEDGGCYRDYHKFAPAPITKPPNKDDVVSILLNNSKVVKDYGFKVTVPLEEGIKKTIEWYRKNGLALRNTFTHLKGMK